MLLWFTVWTSFVVSNFKFLQSDLEEVYQDSIISVSQPRHPLHDPAGRASLLNCGMCEDSSVTWETVIQWVTISFTIIFGNFKKLNSG